jgi:hypothetical protein
MSQYTPNTEGRKEGRKEGGREGRKNKERMNLGTCLFHPCLPVTILSKNATPNGYIIFSNGTSLLSFISHSQAGEKPT